MLDALDDRSFAALEDAYGPAVDVPARLRRIGSEDRENARAELGDLAAGIFHQGSYYSSTAPAVPFLIELAAAAIPARADVLLLLADMSGASTDPELAYQPYLFHSTPGLPDYPEAVATIEAIRAGRETFSEALSADDAEVRACAAHLLAGLADDSVVAPLELALARETDPLVRVTLHFGLARWGRRVATNESGLVADVVATLALATERERGLAAIRRLLVEPPLKRERMPCFDGDLVRFAAVALVQHAGDDPRAFELAEQALHERLARGETIRELPRPISTRICDDPDAGRSISFADYFADVPLRTIAGAMTSLAFGERVRDPSLLRPEQLDDRMRRVLELTCDHDIPVAIAGAPWIDRAAMARFLAGGGPLDDEFEWQGERLALFVVLASLTREAEAEAEAGAEQLFTALARSWPPERMIALAIDILDDGYGLAPYGPPVPALRNVFARQLEPLAQRCPELLSAYAERLLEREDTTGAQVQFAFARAIAAREAVEPRFDRLAGQAIASAVEPGKVWLASFPEPRRSRIVAKFGNRYLFDQLASVCDPATLEVALIEAFLDPTCAWFEHDAESVLATITDTGRLEALLAETSGRRRTVLARVVRTRTRAGVFVLDLRNDGDAIRAILRDGTDRVLDEARLSASPRVDELVPLVELCVGEGELAIELAGDIDPTSNYRVMRLLPEAGFHGRVQSGGTTYQGGGSR
jgi:hypothetical protein